LTVLGAAVREGSPAELGSHHRPVVVDLAGRDDEATTLRTEPPDEPRRRIA
jgi:hypothetical protein